MDGHELIDLGLLKKREGGGGWKGVNRTGGQRNTISTNSPWIITFSASVCGVMQVNNSLIHRHRHKWIHQTNDNRHRRRITDGSWDLPRRWSWRRRADISHISSPPAPCPWCRLWVSVSPSWTADINVFGFVFCFFGRFSLLAVGHQTHALMKVCAAATTSKQQKHAHKAVRTRKAAGPLLHKARTVPPTSVCVRAHVHEVATVGVVLQGPTRETVLWYNEQPWWIYSVS